MSSWSSQNSSPSGQHGEGGSPGLVVDAGGGARFLGAVPVMDSGVPEVSEDDFNGFRLLAVVLVMLLVVGAAGLWAAWRFLPSATGDPGLVLPGDTVGYVSVKTPSLGQAVEWRSLVGAVAEQVPGSVSVDVSVEEVAAQTVAEVLRVESVPVSLLAGSSAVLIGVLPHDGVGESTGVAVLQEPRTFVGIQSPDDSAAVVAQLEALNVEAGERAGWVFASSWEATVPRVLAAGEDGPVLASDGNYQRALAAVGGRDAVAVGWVDGSVLQQAEALAGQHAMAVGDAAAAVQAHGGVVQAKVASTAVGVPGIGPAPLQRVPQSATAAVAVGDTSPMMDAAARFVLPSERGRGGQFFPMDRTSRQAVVEVTDAFTGSVVVATDFTAQVMQDAVTQMLGGGTATVDEHVLVEVTGNPDPRQSVRTVNRWLADSGWPVSAQARVTNDGWTLGALPRDGASLAGNAAAMAVLPGSADASALLWWDVTGSGVTELTGDTDLPVTALGATMGTHDGMSVVTVSVKVAS